ncbi:LysR family transcriptional regulator [Anaeromicropila populeti]|uniref:DNA-binding transcriptional regulator, LysR family n=1 Tax=Anaeromicropila populeti TaxID=37658 RepID=A0A1I6HSJ1_9FIRM|nr:LysR family transcriptional regulator [Anaeromicropila populeti]SFR57393.1 DNA-binding transcriptional regulator, LysR family [Anaeromicropila populeti]
MNDISLELYKIFYYVATQGNISKASELLFIGQPAVSRSIQKLESMLGISLFYRTNKGVHLTDTGEILYEYVSEAMENLFAGEQAIKDVYSKEQNTLTLGISSTLYKLFILPYLKEFLKHNNLIINFIDCSSSYNTLDLLAQGDVDIGIVSKPFDLTGIEFYPLNTIQEVIVATPNYIKKNKIKNQTDFCKKITLISLQKGNITREYNEQYLKKLNIEMEPEITTSSMDFIVDLVRQEMGAGIVFKEIVANELKTDELMEVSFLPPIPKRQIGIAMKNGKVKTKAIQKFIKYYSLKT